MKPEELAVDIDNIIRTSTSYQALITKSVRKAEKVYPLWPNKAQGVKFYQKVTTPNLPPYAAISRKAELYGSLHLSMLRLSIFSMIVKMGVSLNPGLQMAPRQGEEAGKRQEYLKQVRARGMSAGLFALVRYEPLYQEALIKLGWEQNKQAQRTTVLLLCQHGGEPLPMNLVLTGLLMGIPAEQFIDLDGHPHHLLDALLEAELTKEPADNREQARGQQR